MLFYLVLGLNRQPTLQVPELILRSLSILLEYSCNCSNCNSMPNTNLWLSPLSWNMTWRNSWSWTFSLGWVPARAESKQQQQHQQQHQHQQQQQQQLLDRAFNYSSKWWLSSSRLHDFWSAEPSKWTDQMAQWSPTLGSDDRATVVGLRPDFSVKESEKQYIVSIQLLFQ